MYDRFTDFISKREERRVIMSKLNLISAVILKRQLQYMFIWGRKTFLIAQQSFCFPCETAQSSWLPQNFPLTNSLHVPSALLPRGKLQVGFQSAAASIGYSDTQMRVANTYPCYIPVMIELKRGDFRWHARKLTCRAKCLHQIMWESDRLYLRTFSLLTFRLHFKTHWNIFKSSLPNFISDDNFTALFLKIYYYYY